MSSFRSPDPSRRPETHKEFTTIMSLCKKSSNYVGHMFAPGLGKMLARKPWFADACERGCECPQCPWWLEEYLTPQGFDDAKIREMLKDTALHAKVCLLMHKFKDRLGMTMEHATDAEWGAIPNEECDFETSVKIIGIVVGEKIVEQITLPRNPRLAITAVNCVVQLELYNELDCAVAPFVG